MYTRRVGKNGDTALVVASFLGHASVVVRLLAAAPDSIDVNCADGAGKLALISACSNTASDNSAVVGALVARPDVDVNATDREQSTALMQAAYTGNSAAVKELIARRVCVYRTASLVRTYVQRAQRGSYNST